MKLIYIISLTSLLQCNYLNLNSSKEEVQNTEYLEISIPIEISKNYLIKQNFVNNLKFTNTKMKITMSGYGGCTCSEGEYKIENNTINFTHTNSCYINGEPCDNWISKFKNCFLENNNTNLEYKENLVCKDDSFLRKFDNLSKPEDNGILKIYDNMQVITVLKKARITKKIFCLEQPIENSKQAIINKDLLIYGNDESSIEDPLLPGESIKVLASIPKSEWYLINADHESFLERCWIKRDAFEF